MPLSYSQLRRYRTCPRQYEFSNIKKIPWGISEGESFGSSVHNALKKWGEIEAIGLGVGVGVGKQKKEVREDQLVLFAGEAPAHSSPILTEEKLIEFWHASFIVDTYKTRLEADFARKRGEEIMRRFFAWWSAASRRVAAIEKSFTVAMGGLPISGRLDRIEETEDAVRIIDFKTTQPCTQAEADADLQLSIYALASVHLFKKPCAELVLLFLSDEGIVERTTLRSLSQLKDAEKQIQLIHERLEARDFRPTPSAQACRRCPYRGICDVAAI
ncbi:MAG: PD-(D/E)XK nuclease family protein [Candidatus Peribacteraceae bacterium]|nr:PD-(D/E)XK nuclease family protein [Candidatus Peribacteraceae bacterium]